MEVLHLYGSEQQKKQWLEPLLDGKIRSCYCMTEPAVASSDATNLQCEIKKEGENYIINGRKWWISGAGDPRCSISILMGSTPSPTSPPHRQHSMILVPFPSPGLKILRPMTVFNLDDAPHGHMEIEFRNVIVPKENIIVAEGKGFEIS
jgi:alkylation response protein AidB-like acyl-CoA dehydrogenase